MKQQTKVNNLAARAWKCAGVSGIRLHFDLRKSRCIVGPVAGDMVPIPARPAAEKMNMKEKTKNQAQGATPANIRRGIVCNGCAVPLVRLRGTAAARLTIAVAPAGARGIR